MVRNIYTDAYGNAEELRPIYTAISQFKSETNNSPVMYLAKLGQDGHDRGQKVIAAAFADLGFDVVTGPLFQTPDEVYDLAISHDVDAVGISTLAAAHLSQVPQLRKKLDAGAGQHIELVVGGVVPVSYTHLRAHET